MARTPKAEYEIRSKDNSKQGIQSAQTGLKNLGKGVATAAKGMTVAFAGVTAAAAAVYAGINKLTSIYAEQEKAEIKLIAASRNNPMINGDGVQGLRDFASSLQDISTYGDEALIPLMSMGVNMGLTQQQIEGVSEAAVNLAAATDMSLDSAFRNLYKTLGGTAGELGETIPAMRDLTEEALKNGEAIELITRQYGGMAEAVRESTAGSKEAFRNMLGDVAEQAGQAFAPLQRMMRERLTPIMEDVGRWFTENSSRITNFFLNFGEIARLTFVHIKKGLAEAFTWDNIVTTAQAFWTYIKDSFVNVGRFLWQVVVSLGTTIWLPLKKGFEWAAYGIKVAWRGMMRFFSRLIDVLVEGPINWIGKAFHSIINGIKVAFEFVVNAMIDGLNFVLRPLDRIMFTISQIEKHGMRFGQYEEYQPGTGAGGVALDRISINTSEWEDLSSNIAERWEEAVEPPANEWEDIWNRIRDSWQDTGNAAVDTFKNQVNILGELGGVLADPFVIGFEGFTTEFVDILNRELPPEAQNLVTNMMADIESAVSTATASYSSVGYQPYMGGSGSGTISLWDIFTIYVSNKFEDFANNLESFVGKIWDGIKGVGSKIQDAGDFLKLAFTEPKEALASAGFAFIRSIRRLADKSDEILAAMGSALAWGAEQAGKALVSLGGWIYDMLMRTEGMSQVMETLSESISAIMEKVVVPLVQVAQPLIDVLIQLINVLMTALKPVIGAIAESIKILIPVFQALTPLIQAIVNVLEALSPILVMFTELVAQLLIPIIDILSSLFNILADVLAKIAPVFEAIFGAIFNILAPILQFVADLLQIIAPILDFVADILLAIAPIIEAVGQLIGGILGPALEFIAELLSVVLNPILTVLGQVLTVLTPLFQVVATIMTALIPIFNIVFKLLQVLLIPLDILGTLLELITPLFEILAAVLDVLNPIIEFFAKAIDAITRPIEFVADLLMFLGMGIKAALQTIWYLITFQWGKLGDIEWPSFSSDAFTRPLGDFDSPTVELQPVDVTTSDLVTGVGGVNGATGSTNAGTTYGGQNLTVNVTIQAEAIVGEPGLREFALMIENEIQKASSLGLV